MPDGAEPASGSFPSRRSLREAGMLGGPDRGASAVIPFLAELRTDRPLPLEHQEPYGASRERRPLTVRRALSVACALSCVAGLFLTVALPALSGRAAGPEPAAALPHQELSESAASTSLADPFDAFGAVAAEATGDPVDFVNFTDAAVQFPFAAGQELTDGFGPRSYPVAGMHDAQDFAAPEGTTVQAIARGKVLETGDTTDGCGFGVLLEHRIDGMDVTSRYCHMQWASNDLEVGQWVDVGDPIGRVGATGLAFGAHLHFALTIDGEAVDPMPFLFTYNRLTRPE